MSRMNTKQPVVELERALTGARVSDTEKAMAAARAETVSVGGVVRLCPICGCETSGVHAVAATNRLLEHLRRAHGGQVASGVATSSAGPVLERGGVRATPAPSRPDVTLYYTGDDELRRSGTVAGLDWLVLPAGRSRRLGEQLRITLGVGSACYQLTGVVTSDSRLCTPLFLTSASAGWQELAGRAMARAAGHADLFAPDPGDAHDFDES